MNAISRENAFGLLVILVVLAFSLFPKNTRANQVPVFISASAKDCDLSKLKLGQPYKAENKPDAWYVDIYHSLFDAKKGTIKLQDGVRAHEEKIEYWRAELLRAESYNIKLIKSNIDDDTKDRQIKINMIEQHKSTIEACSNSLDFMLANGASPYDFLQSVSLNLDVDTLKQLIKHGLMLNGTVAFSEERCFFCGSATVASHKQLAMFYAIRNMPQPHGGGLGRPNNTSQYLAYIESILDAKEINKTKDSSGRNLLGACPILST